MSPEQIIGLLPYTKPFLFVDAISSVSDEEIEGSYTFPADSFFYEGHFKGNPITPGVILTECMAQIGLVSLGIYKLKEHSHLSNLQVAFTSADVQFLKPVLPDDKVIVKASVDYFRFNKLKCKVKLYCNEILACEGALSGVFKVEGSKKTL